MNLLKWPYEEFKMSKDLNRKKINFSTPWVQLSLPMTPEIENTVIEVNKILENKNISVQDRENMNTFLQSFENYPVYYVLPVEKKGENLDLIGESLESQSPMGVVKKVIELGKSFDGLNIDNFNYIEPCMFRSHFSWNSEEALDKARINDKIHPESILSICRRYYYNDVIEYGKGVQGIYQRIASFEDKKKAWASALIVKQNWYVTNRCEKAIQPALMLTQNAKAKVEAFIKEEKGHDKLLLRSLQAIPNDIEVSPTLTVKCLMDTLELAASKNFLAFAILVDFFERSPYTKEDPLASMLKSCGFEESARYINSHMNINDEGQHEMISFDLLESVGLCSIDYAREAIAIAELGTLFMNQMLQNLFDTQIENGYQ